MDAELGHGARRGANMDLPNSDVLAHTRPPISAVQVLGVFFMVLLVLGVLPASMVFWLCVGIILFGCVRMRVQAQRMQDEQEQASALGLHAHRGANVQGLGPFGPGGPIIRVIPGGGLLMLHTNPRTALQRVDAHMRDLDEEMGAAELNLLAQLAAQRGVVVPGVPAPARPTPVTDVDLATLPCYPYKLPRGAASGGGPAGGAGAASGTGAAEGKAAPSSAPASQGAGAAAAAGGAAGAEGGSVGAAAAPAAGAAAPGSGRGGDGGGGGLTCSVCLESVGEGQMVMTLPCLHGYHAACITPWLRRQGMGATCPMCKTPVFRG